MNLRKEKNDKDESDFSLRCVNMRAAEEHDLPLVSHGRKPKRQVRCAAGRSLYFLSINIKTPTTTSRPQNVDPSFLRCGLRIDGSSKIMRRAHKRHDKKRGRKAIRIATWAKQRSKSHVCLARACSSAKNSERK
jgi:hypothetical protein